MITQIFHEDQLRELHTLLSHLTTVESDVEDVVSELSRYLLDDPVNNCLLVYVLDGKIVGHVKYIQEKKVAKGKYCIHLEDLVVHPDYRGRGIAQELVNMVVYDAKLANGYKVILDCKKELVPFYEKLGFVESGVQMRMDI